MHVIPRSAIGKSPAENLDTRNGYSSDFEFADRAAADPDRDRQVPLELSLLSVAFRGLALLMIDRAVKVRSTGTELNLISDNGDVGQCRLLT